MMIRISFDEEDKRKKEIYQKEAKRIQEEIVALCGIPHWMFQKYWLRHNIREELKRTK